MTPIGTIGGKEKIDPRTVIKPGPPPLPKKSKPLTNAEVKDYAPKMTVILKKAFVYADEGISMTNRAGATAFIWQRLDDDDIGVLVAVTMSLGQKVGVAGESVRGIVENYNYLVAGMITVPKFWETFKFYAKHGGFALFPDVKSEDTSLAQSKDV